MNIISNIKSRIIPDVQQTEYFVGADLLTNLHKISAISESNFSSFLLLSDETVFKLYGQQVLRSLNNFGKDIVISTITPGEKSKDFRLLPKVIKTYFQKGFNRKSCLISLGGGVVTDIGGFLASILLRGIANINIPTTLLGQIDAAIGGKSGVDFWASGNLMYKNMIGRINQPKMVISDVALFKTLPNKEILNGLGEMVKYWVGWGKPTIEQLFMIKKAIKTPERWLKDSSQVEELVKIISLCQRIKLDVITKDPFEQSGERQKLNLGHTIGHAIEGAGNGILSHGQAVAIGLAGAAKISFLKKLCNENTFKKIKSALQSLSFPTNFHVTMYRNMITKNEMIQSIKSALAYDKKGGAFVLIKDIGKLEINVVVEENIIEKVLEEVIL